MSQSWECSICWGHSSNILNATATVIVHDSDQQKWLKCTLCERTYHLHCVENLPKDVIEEDFSSEGYNCEQCGWFMVGAYDSD
jgi:hypothetical protein